MAGSWDRGLSFLSGSELNRATLCDGERRKDPTPSWERKVDWHAKMRKKLVGASYVKWRKNLVLA
jgi:hypothetical protein